MISLHSEGNLKLHIVLNELIDPKENGMKNIAKICDSYSQPLQIS